jgi:excisionase family DNA binding protein
MPTPDDPDSLDALLRTPLVTPEDAARLLNASSDAVRRTVRRRGLRALRLGQVVRFHPDAVRRPAEAVPGSGL